ncbi:MAG: hypothetical protein JW863_14895 [Chitinispirillaceae bacterium]|nr:hypothetical protein [Chitinispirillaceae bacterium]
MYTKICRSIAVSLAGFLLFHCSSLDQYTGVGEDIIKENDPSFMDFNGNFFSLSLDSGCVTDKFSLPVDQGSGFGKHSGVLAAGTAGDYLAYGYVQFQVGVSFARNFDSTYEFDSVMFVFDTLYDTTKAVIGSITSGRFNLYRCDSANADNLLADKMYDTAMPICTLTQVDEDSPHWSGKLVDDALADSIFNQCREALTCFNETEGSKSEKTTHCDTTLPIDFFIALCSADDSLAWFNSTSGHYPAMVIHAHHSDSEKDTVISTSDTLRGYPTLVVAETDTLSATNAPRPLSSWLPGRIAVFELNLGTLWDTMKTTGFTELLSAGIVINGDLLTTDNNDTVPPVNYFLSADHITDIDGINRRFSEVNTHYKPVVNLNEPSDAMEIILPVDYHLQHYLDGNKRTFYLYLRLSSSKVNWQQEVLWSTPRFKAVLTTIN